MTAETFPIMGISYNYRKEIDELRGAGVLFAVVAIPWRIIAPHEAQARSNHGQTLNRLAERGGLSCGEAIAIIEDRRWRPMPNAAAQRRLIEIIQAGDRPADDEAHLILRDAAERRDADRGEEN